jgi:adenine-specific DNA-methyltransferase
MKTNSKTLGQYFTPKFIADFMVKMIDTERPNDCKILEPCAGEGSFLRALNDFGYSNIRAFEIDGTIHNNSNVQIIYDDFLLLNNTEDKYDVVIGNPPYVRWKNLSEEMKESLKTSKYWKSETNALGDLLYYFILSSVEKLNHLGELIFITPVFWTQTLHAQEVRRSLLREGSIESIILLGESKLFTNVASTFLIFKFRKGKKNGNVKVFELKDDTKLNYEALTSIVPNINKDSTTDTINNRFFSIFEIDQPKNGNPWLFIPKEKVKIIEQIEKTCSINSPFIEIEIDSSRKAIPLSSLLTKYDLEEFNISEDKCTLVRYLNRQYFIPNQQNLISHGIGQMNRYTRLDDISEIGNGLVSGLDKAFNAEDIGILNELEKSKLILVAKAKYFNRFITTSLAPYIFVNDINSEEELRSDYPNIYKHLLSYRDELLKRYSYNKEIKWWHWVFLRNFELIKNTKKKILVPCKERIDKRNYVRFVLVEGEVYATQDVTSIVIKDGVREKPEYILALLNSNLIFEWLKYKGLKRGGVLEFSEAPLEKIPIRLIDWSDSIEVSIHNEIVSLVRMIMERDGNTSDLERLNFLVELIYTKINRLLNSS